MSYLLFMISIISLGYVISNIFFNESNNFNLLSYKHTGMLKGIAIILVILTHITNLKFNLDIMSPVASLGVMLFLICSGYGVNESYKKNGLRGYWKSKFSKVLLPYILLELIVVLFRENINFVDVVLDCLLIKRMHPYGWFLQYLFIWYLVFYFVTIVKSIQRYRTSIFFIIGLAWLFNPVQLWAEQAFAFVIGIVLSQFKESKFMQILSSGRSSSYTSIICLTAGIAFYTLRHLQVTNGLLQIIFNNIIWLVAKTFISFAILFLVYHFKSYINQTYFLFIGAISYALYLLHGYLWWILKDVTFTSITLYSAILVVSSYVYTRMSNRVANYITIIGGIISAQIKSNDNNRHTS